MGVLFVVSREVLAELGGTDAARAILDRVKPADYTCTACGQQGVMDADSPAVVTVMAGPLKVIWLAHPGCSKSVVTTGLPVPRLDPVVLAHGLIWTFPDGPVPMLLLAPRFSTHTFSESGDVVDGGTRGLMGRGFALVTDTTAPVAELPGLVVRRSRGGLLVEMPSGAALYDGGWSDHAEWDDTAATAGRVLVVWASGLRIDNPDRDLLADMFTAIGHGHVVAAAGRYVPDSRSNRRSVASRRPRRRR